MGWRSPASSAPSAKRLSVSAFFVCCMFKECQWYLNKMGAIYMYTSMRGCRARAEELWGEIQNGPIWNWFLVLDWQTWLMRLHRLIVPPSMIDCIDKTLSSNRDSFQRSDSRVKLNRFIRPIKGLRIPRASTSPSSASCGNIVDTNYSEYLESVIGPSIRVLRYVVPQ